ncbi:ABC transporter substrate-binding protein [Ramlibacter albus]|uniref:ABC transporter substrate-binding protein n=1 Tax=Ramlibacter albus TaxID=2079448 RepID=A0A923MFW2_9BURK|nr:ABC transporter substrate-binding protein [Ramlibacter albus]MBC5768509.1 ABC transporter substrate-binding protein [Ramlibacter albus]
MSTRRQAFALVATAAAWPGAWAQQPAGKVWRIGILTTNSVAFMADRVEALRVAMRERGYVEGRNLVLDFRTTDGRDDLLAEVGADIVRQNPDVIVSHGLVPRILKKLTTTIPVVITDTVDPVGQGLAVSLARPGGNFTGQVFFGEQIAAKRVELLKQALPRLPHLGLLHVSTYRAELMAVRANELQLKATAFFVEPGEVQYAPVFAAMAKQQVTAMAYADHPTLSSASRAIAEQALKHRIAVAGGPLLAESGGFLGYGVRFPDLWASAALFVDKIFKGARPGDLPIEGPTRFHTVLNAKVARQLGVEVPRTFLANVDQVIE